MNYHDHRAHHEHLPHRLLHHGGHSSNHYNGHQCNSQMEGVDEMNPEFFTTNSIACASSEFIDRVVVETLAFLHCLISWILLLASNLSV